MRETDTLMIVSKSLEGFSELAGQIILDSLCSKCVLKSNGCYPCVLAENGIVDIINTLVVEQAKMN
jgi:hypothetical protein